MSTPDTLPTTTLGASGLRVGSQGLGCMGMSEFYGESDLAESRATLERALELGVTLFDTADVYGMGHNEEFLADFVRAHRDRIVLATKFGIVRKADDPAFRGIDNSPAYLRAAVDASLRRLGIDTIDLYYLHRRDVRVPIEETVGVLAELVAAGKVRALGLSEVTGAELRAAHAVHPIAAVQSEWSLFSRDVERTAVPAAAELGVAFVPYSPLGRGFLTGTVTAADFEENDYRRRNARFQEDALKQNLRIVDVVKRVAERRGATPAQVAIAWTLAQGEHVIPIPGTKKRRYLRENAGAADLELTEQDLAELDDVPAAVGARY